MPRVALVNMPFSHLRWPNIGPSLLKAALARQGIDCDVAYLNFDFAEQLGLDDYYWLGDRFGFVLGGERLFAKHFFAGRLPDDECYYREILSKSDADFGPPERQSYEALQGQVAPFLERVMQDRDWAQYDIVGFTSSFQQTMPSICLAARVKQLRPDVKIMFGGAACDSEMGLELLRLFPLVDFVFLSEADLTFPDVVAQVLAGGPVRLPPGVAGRPGACQSPAAAGDDPTIAANLDRDPYCDLDQLPYPDFDDYFDRLHRSPLGDRIDPLFFFETSRGCWWGQKHHCTFCGLNGSRMTYRSKTPQRAFDELRYLAQRHQVFRGCSADNIFDYRYYNTLLPLMKEANFGLGFMFEMKTNITRAQSDLLVEAGMAGAQLGIETFSTPILKLMDKGSTGMQNLQTLKWFSEAGMIVEWNFLYGFAGEDPAEYAALAELLPSLYHLVPPGAAGRVRSDRFSPYFMHPEAYGLANLRPNAAFAYSFPFPAESLARLAYYFEYDYADGRRVEDYMGPLLERIATWRELTGSVMLRQFDRSDGVLLIHDTRPGAAAFQQRLTGLQRAVYLYCDTGRTLAKIVEHAARLSPESPPPEALLRRMLKNWVDERLMVHLDDRYLSLALRAPAESRSTLPAGQAVGS
jgi:ribosomal peptide maturation radical SAM protein 1